ncbi:SHOCT domain-containing protein [Nisaea sediminum]|uniref:SHOCT domain-containing protein n=1 Tax=Nisaea sediminum TaxID=2775867 RepID=UPI001D00C172|nr:SHOCT domain-containing protein [Nisaea sediminum]
MKTLVPVLASAAAVAAAFPANADPADGYGYHPMMMGGWFMGPFMMLLFVVILIAAALFAARHFSFAPKGDGDKALAILRERFARGEIDKEEFEQRRKLLE